MKVAYVKPETLAVAVIHFESLLLSKSEAPRETGGDPTSEGLPTTVGETDGTTNPFGDDEGDHGQGSGGNGTRSKSGMIWDEW